MIQVIASSLTPPGTVSFDCPSASSALLSALIHILEIEHLLLPDRAFGIVFPHMSIGLICPWTPFTRK